jgi:hypothetical protein
LLNHSGDHSAKRGVVFAVVPISIAHIKEGEGSNRNKEKLAHRVLQKSRARSSTLIQEALLRKFSQMTNSAAMLRGELHGRI